MDNLLFVTEESSKEKGELFLSSFSQEFHYPETLDINVTGKDEYKDYSEDINTIKRGFSNFAELIDTRNLIDYENKPSRFLVTNNFFSLSDAKKIEIFLHEIGHYLTNPQLQKIRNFICIENPKLLNIGNGTLDIKNKVKAHNIGLNFVFQIPKLPQEMYAEMWVYENHKEYSKSRLFEYSKSLDDFLYQAKVADVNQGFFYEIPRINSLILWRKIIMKNTDFEFTEKSLLLLDQSRGELYRLSEDAGWAELEILKSHDEIVESLKYNGEDIDCLIGLYKIIFEEYINISLKFFPSSIHRDIKQLYNLN